MSDREEFVNWMIYEGLYGWSKNPYDIQRLVETAYKKGQAALESEGWEAVAIVDGSGVLQWMPPFNRPDPGTKLYTHPPKQQSVEFGGWYCAHCQRGVDGSEVTYNEQHQQCGRVITNDEPPAPQPDKWIPCSEERQVFRRALLRSSRPNPPEQESE